MGDISIRLWRNILNSMETTGGGVAHLDTKVGYLQNPAYPQVPELCTEIQAERKTEIQMHSHPKTCCATVKMGPPRLCPIGYWHKCLRQVWHNARLNVMGLEENIYIKCIYSKFDQPDTLYHWISIFLYYRFSHFRPGGHRSLDANGPAGASHWLHLSA